MGNIKKVTNAILPENRELSGSGIVLGVMMTAASGMMVGER